MTIVAQLKELVAEERKITAEVIRLLGEVEGKLIYAELGYPSIYDFCVKELGLSEGAAHRRISAMRLQKEMPDCASKIEQGEISLSAATKVQTVIRQAKKRGVKLSQEQKEDLFAAACGASSRQAEAQVVEVAESLGVELPKKEAVLPPDIVEKLAKLQALLSHKYPQHTKEELLHVLLDAAIAKHDPAAKKQRDTADGVSGERPPVKVANQESVKREEPSRYCPAEVKRAVWARDEGQCAYVDPETGRRCGSRHFLELHHVKAFAKGGETTADNLRLYCRAHNCLEAKREGLGRYWRSASC